MSTQFFTRYVPSTTKKSPQPLAALAPQTELVERLQKRKRGQEEDAEKSTKQDGGKKRKKKRKDGGEEVLVKKNKKEKKGEKEKKEKEKKKKGAATVTVDEEVEPAPEMEPTPKGKGKEKGKKQKHAPEETAVIVEPGLSNEDASLTEKNPDPGPSPTTTPLEDAVTPKYSLIAQKLRQSLVLASSGRIPHDVTHPPAPEEALAVAPAVEVTTLSAKAPGDKFDPEPSEEIPAGGHLRILLKAHRSLAKASTQPASETATLSLTPEEAPTVEATGLEPLPQPEPTKTSKPISALSSLPQWLKDPVSVSPTIRTPFPSISGLSSKLQSRLAFLNLTEAFAVQTTVLPLLLERRGGGDLCISAATGSGKTLAYLLPIIQSLSSKVVTRLRAIIIVPTRELVQQVNTTAVSLAFGTGLKIGTAVGSRSFAVEKGLLVAAEESDEMSSKIDILISTPGRLVEHVRATPGFDLTWVKWLVIDEADRLLAQSFHEWVDVVIVGLKEAATKHTLDKMAGVDLGDLGLQPWRSEREVVRKIVLSATMTRDIGKLAGLRLRKPKLVVVEDPLLPEGAEVGGDQDEELEQFSVPAGLREHVTPIEDVEYKPLYLMYLLRLQGIKTGILIFVKSNEGAARLAKLLETVAEASATVSSFTVGLVTGEMEKKRREKVLKRFAKGEVDLLVCSDLISRGLDLPNIRHIINYDIPASTRAYIHRVGRTARAGNGGDAWTLLANNEARWFWMNIGKAVRRAVVIRRVPVMLEAKGVGLRGAYEGVLYGS